MPGAKPTWSRSLRPLPTVWLDGGMLIRDAHRDEFPEIGEIRVGAYLADGFLSPDSGYAPMLRELGTDGLDPVLVAVADDGALTGTVMLQVWPHGGEVVKSPDEAEIRALAVRPEARGGGIGRALLAAVIDRAALLGVQHLVLLTQQEMKAAHHLYATAGFSRLPERDWSPEPDVRLLAYGMVLGPGGVQRDASCTRASRLGLAEAWGTGRDRTPARGKRQSHAGPGQASRGAVVASGGSATRSAGGRRAERGVAAGRARRGRMGGRPCAGRPAYSDRPARGSHRGDPAGCPDL